MTKLQMKVSGCFRTLAGAERFAHMRGFIKTACKRKWHLLDLLRRGPNAAVPQLHPVPP